MKTQKRFVVTGGAILIILVIAVMGIAEAFGGEGRCGWGPSIGPFGGGFHRHGFEGAMPGFMLKRLDRKVKELNLTPGQQVKYDELRDGLKTHLSAAKEDRLRFREMAGTEMAKESPDVHALTAAIKAKIETVSGVLKNDLDLFESFYSTLDESQKQKLMAGIKKKMAAMKDCREEGR